MTFFFDLTNTKGLQTYLLHNQLNTIYYDILSTVASSNQLSEHLNIFPINLCFIQTILQILKYQLIQQQQNHHNFFICVNNNNMYLRSMKNYQSMNVVYTTPQGNELWLGDYYAATDLSLLKKKKITSVLTAAAMLGVKYPKQADIAHKVLNAFDIPTYKMTPHFQEAYQFIKNGLQNGNILVHCAAGISRSTTCVLVYLMRQKHYGFKQSLQMVKGKRPIVNPNYGFQNQLSRYELTLNKGGLKVGGKKEEEKVFSQKPERTIQQIQQQKNAFYTFMNKETGLNKTVGASGTKYNKATNKKVAQQPLIYSSNKPQQQKQVRGQSLNYNKSAIGSQNKVLNLTFKLEQPKIVTIKK